MKLDFTALSKAQASLEKAITRATAASDDEELRDAVIQRFEYTFELCWKMLKRVLESEAPVPSSVDQMSYKDLLREAAEKGILSKIEDWMEFRDQRNLTSHSYDAKKAASVFKTALIFSTESKLLLKTLKNRSK
jgi:nucleotidyltransferase substrate binding protein (TIGR01987 family)